MIIDKKPYFEPEVHSKCILNMIPIQFKYISNTIEIQCTKGGCNRASTGPVGQPGRLRAGSIGPVQPRLATGPVEARLARSTGPVAARVRITFLNKTIGELGIAQTKFPVPDIPWIPRFSAKAPLARSSGAGQGCLNSRAVSDSLSEGGGGFWPRDRNGRRG